MVTQLINALDEAFLRDHITQDGEKVIYLIQALRPDIVWDIQLLRGYTYSSQVKAAKAYSDAMISTISFLREEVRNINTFLKTFQFCEYCMTKGHNMAECIQKNGSKTTTRNRKLAHSVKDSKNQPYGWEVR